MEKNLHQILKFFVVVSSLLLGTGHVITITHIYKRQIDSTPFNPIPNYLFHTQLKLPL